MNILKILVVGAVLALPAADPTTFRTSFCPECWEFAGDETSLDRAGRCMSCGRAPAWAEAVNIDWYGCSSREAWRRSPCAQDPQRKCCLRRSGTAIVVFERADEVFSSWYCPECHRFQAADYERPSERCIACGKRYAVADTVYRRWYWCKAGEEWLDEPCLSSRGRRCCEERAGMILAFPFVPPIPRPIPTAYTCFVARLLGYDARLYDGSFVEWSGRPELPVESNWAGR